MDMIQIRISSKGGDIGGVFLFHVPIETRLDFSCVPKGLLSYADIEAIGKDQAAGITRGAIREYDWEVSGEVCHPARRSFSLAAS
jgi:hypothetical protein